MSKTEKIIYEPHPVTAERKQELREQGYKIIDAQFAPDDIKADLAKKALKGAVKKPGDFNREEAFKYLAEQGVRASHMLGDAKLKALFDEAKAAQAEKEEAERKAAEGSQE